jgi:transcriptional regulator with XRE-family HTH domain|tara:strand:- start:1503 stop:1727 length:225 start_codon:yes stop_codon:yes gene_type:complete
MNNLQKLLKDFNVSQTELSRKTGVPQPTINRFLNGKTKSPSYSITRKIAGFFDVSVDYLHGNETINDRPRLLEE